MSFDFEKVYEDEFISIEVDDNKRFIQVVWLKHPNSDAFRRGFIKGAEITLARNCRFWLSDSRAIHYLEFAEQNWLLDFMAPMLGDSCLSKFARVNSQESLALLDIDRILYRLESSPHVRCDLEVAVFMHKQEALNWLFPEAEQLQAPLLQKKGASQGLSAPLIQLH